MVSQNDENEPLYEPDAGSEGDLFEEIDSTEGDLKERVRTLSQELKKCIAERKTYLEGWQRAKADYLNSRKRADEEREEIARRTEANMLKKLLPFIDSFTLALDAPTSTQEGDPWRAGLQQIHGQLGALLRELEVTEVASVGETFDPHRHEAISSQPVPDADLHDKVVAVLQKGYMHRSLLLRPAKVVIGVAS